MAVWVLQRALEALDELPPHYRAGAGRGAGDPRRGAGPLARHHPQDEGRVPRRRRAEPVRGLRAAARVRLGGLPGAYGDIQRLDRVLEAEGDSTNRYKVAKQADVLMLLFLLSRQELRGLLRGPRLRGERRSSSRAPSTTTWSAPRTARRSAAWCSAWVLARYDPEEAWRFLQRALESDIADVQGGTTAEGIHLGAMAGTVDLVLRCLTGMRARGAGAAVRPGAAAADQAAPLQHPLPGPPRRCRLRRGPHWRSDSRPGRAAAITVLVRDETVELHPRVRGTYSRWSHSRDHAGGAGRARRPLAARAARAGTSHCAWTSTARWRRSSMTRTRRGRCPASSSCSVRWPPGSPQSPWSRGARRLPGRACRCAGVRYLGMYGLQEIRDGQGRCGSIRG